MIILASTEGQAQFYHSIGSVLIAMYTVYTK